MTALTFSIIGGGAWGTALAQIFATDGKDILLYTREQALADTINQSRENNIYLPNVKLHAKVTATADIAVAAKRNIIFLTTPAQFLRETFKKMSPHITQNSVLINCSKGIEIGTGLRISEIAAQILPANPYAVLSGPNFAHEIAQGLPAAATLATKENAATANVWATAIRTPHFRPYLSHDPIGVEIAGALKNVIAIACGMAEGKKLGQNAKAAVMTRGMAEIKRFGLAHGALAETFLGLAGFGDLTLTCHSMSSRNFSLGFELAQGKTLQQITAARKSVAEGVATAKAVCEAARIQKIDLPIISGVHAVLHGNMKIDTVMHDLLSRDLKEENL